MSRGSAERSACIFCTGRVNSREHAWPDWLLRFVAPADGFIRAEREGEAPRQWPGRNGVQVKRVCVPCNTGWMSDLDEEASPLLKPMIRGEQAELRERDQLSVATWCVKTAMVWDCVRPHPKTYFLQAERDYLFDARARTHLNAPIPPDTIVFLARYTGRNPAFTHASELLLSLPGHRGPVLLRCHVSTFAAGQFVAQVSHIRLRPEDKARGLAVGAEEVQDSSRGRWNGAAVLVWPLSSRTVNWPLLTSIGDDLALEDFALRWPRQSTWSQDSP